MPAWDGLQPDVLWREDRGAGRDRVLLAPALVPRDPGSGTGGNTLHHYHLYPKVSRADSQSQVSAVYLVNADISWTHLMVGDCLRTDTVLPAWLALEMALVWSVTTEGVVFWVSSFFI